MQVVLVKETQGPRCVSMRYVALRGGVTFSGLVPRWAVRTSSYMAKSSLSYHPTLNWLDYMLWVVWPNT